MNDPLPATSRRSFLKLVGAMGAASAFAGTLSACGSPSATTSSPAGGSGTGTITAAHSALGGLLIEVRLPLAHAAEPPA